MIIYILYESNKISTINLKNKQDIINIKFQKKIVQGSPRKYVFIFYTNQKKKIPTRN